MAAPTLTVEVSTDGSAWTDISNYVGANTVGWGCRRGRSSILSQWQPGALNITFRDKTRALDATNDNATWALSAGNYIRLKLNTVAAWYGWIEDIVPVYEKASTGPLLSLRVVAGDGLSRLSKLEGTCGDNESAISGTAIAQTYNQIGYTANRSTAAGTIRISNAAYGDGTTIPVTNGLTWVQQVTLTEGGASRLYTSKSGTLTWKGRTWRPINTVVFGTGGIPLTDFTPDRVADDWANYVTITPQSHTDYTSSTTSLAVGTGSKVFTVSYTSGALGVSSGATVTVASAGTPSATMTGTVTSYSGTTLTCNITATTGSGTHADWNITTVEPATAQTVYDAQSLANYGANRAVTLSTLHNTRTAALNAAYIRAAEQAWNNPRLTMIETELAALSSAQVTSVLGLEIGDAVDVSVDLATGSPSTLDEIRLVDGIEHIVDGRGSHLVRIYLGRVPTVDFTVDLQQNASSVAATTNMAAYTVRDGWCTGIIKLSATAAGTNNTAITVVPTGLPALHSDLASAFDAAGWFEYNDSGTRTQFGHVRWDDTMLTLRLHERSGDTTNSLGMLPAFAIASGDSLYINLSFPVA